MELSSDHHTSRLGRDRLSLPNAGNVTLMLDPVSGGPLISIGVSFSGTGNNANMLAYRSAAGWKYDSIPSAGSLAFDSSGGVNIGSYGNYQGVVNGAQWWYIPSLPRD